MNTAPAALETVSRTISRLYQEARLSSGRQVCHFQLIIGVTACISMAVPVRLLAPDETVRAKLFEDSGISTSYIDDYTAQSLALVTKPGDKGLDGPAFSRPERTALPPLEAAGSMGPNLAVTTTIQDQLNERMREILQSDGTTEAAPTPPPTAAAPEPAEQVKKSPGKKRSTPFDLPSHEGNDATDVLDEAPSLWPRNTAPDIAPAPVAASTAVPGATQMPQQAKVPSPGNYQPVYTQPPVQPAAPQYQAPAAPSAPTMPATISPSPGFWVYYPQVGGWMYYTPSPGPVPVNQAAPTGYPTYSSAPASAPTPPANYPASAPAPSTPAPAPGPAAVKRHPIDKTTPQAPLPAAAPTAADANTPARVDYEYTALLAQSDTPTAPAEIEEPTVTATPAPAAAEKTVPVTETTAPESPMADPSVTYPEMKVSPVKEAPNPPQQQQAPVEAAAQNDPLVLLRNKQYALLVPLIMENQDAGMARALGWTLFKDKNYKVAGEWFTQSLSWDDSSHETYYGLALCEFNQGNLRQAEAYARWHKDVYPGMKNLLGDILTERAMTAYEAGQFSPAIQYLDEVEDVRGLTAQEQEVYAWSLFKSGEYQLAAARFENLYAKSLDQRSAEGLFASYAKLENFDHVGRLSERYNGPLDTMYREHMGRVSYDQGLYRTAAAYDPSTYGVLANSYQKRTSFALGFHSKSGENDLDEFDIETLPALDFTFPVNDFSTVGIEVTAKNYGQAAIGRDDLFGTVPDVRRPRFRVAPVSDYSTMVGANVRYEREGGLSPYIEIGAQQAIEGIDAVYLGEAGIGSGDGDYNWNVAVYRDTIEESVLSAIGQRDPYTGKVWGGVTETGIKGDVLLEFDHDIMFYSRASGGALSGTNVASNEHWNIAGGFKKDYDVSGFEYVSVGPVFTYDRYSRNLSQYTFGHGGYFSPQNLIQGTLGLEFLTEEGHEFLVKGSLGAGAQQNSQDSTAFFPLDDDGRSYRADDGSSGIFYVNLSGAHQLTDMLNFGAGLSYAATPSYDEFSAIFYLSLRFDTTPGLLLHDLLY